MWARAILHQLTFRAHFPCQAHSRNSRPQWLSLLERRIVHFPTASQGFSAKWFINSWHHSKMSERWLPRVKRGLGTVFQRTLIVVDSQELDGRLTVSLAPCAACLYGQKLAGIFRAVFLTLETEIFTFVLTNFEEFSDYTIVSFKCWLVLSKMRRKPLQSSFSAANKIDLLTCACQSYFCSPNVSFHNEDHHINILLEIRYSQ